MRHTMRFRMPTILLGTAPLHQRQRLRATDRPRQRPRARSDGRRASRRRDRSGGRFARADGGDRRHRSLPLRCGAAGQRRADVPPAELQRAATVRQRRERRAVNADVVSDALAQRRRHRHRSRHVSQRRRCREPGGEPRRHRASASQGAITARSSTRARSCARAKCSRPCPAWSSASTAARARPTSTTCAASTSITAPTSRRRSPACRSTCRRGAHGHGYSDLNFLIPELVSGVQFKKGPYFADQGDFSTAGAANINYVNQLERPIVRVERRRTTGWGRLLGAASPRVGGGHLLGALEVQPQRRPVGAAGRLSARSTASLRYSRGDNATGSR